MRTSGDYDAGKKKAGGDDSADGGSTSGSADGVASSAASSARQARASTSSLPDGGLSRRERLKGALRNLMKPRQNSRVILNPDSDMNNVRIGAEQTNGEREFILRNPMFDAVIYPAAENWEVTSDLPDHSLKIYKADQSFKYLPIHQYTSAREVVMLALQEFSISECSSNFTLTEVTVEGGFVKQKRLPNDQTNLAERIGLASRYYIKNVMNSEQLIADESELAKESQVSLLQLNAVEIAMQLMVEDFKVFRTIGT